MPPAHDAAVDWVSEWWDSESGIPADKVAELEAYLGALESRAVQAREVVSEGSVWGYLDEVVTARTLAPGTQEPAICSLIIAWCR